MLPESLSAAVPHKMRKLRKGTHSCQQCRRRKAKCVFDVGDSNRCTGCRSRGLDCRSQTTSIGRDDAGSAAPRAKRAPTKDLAHRIAQLEHVIGDMAGSQASNLRYPSSSTSEEDILHDSVAQNARAVTAVGPGFSNLLHMQADDPGFSEQKPISAELYRLLPDESTSSILMANGPSMFLGRTAPEDAHPPICPTDHPALIAKRLIVLALCLQQLPSSFDMSSLVLPGKTAGQDGSATIRAWVAGVDSLVSSNDSLISNAEGIEVLTLQAVIQADAGQLRKAWMTGRKAICIATLLGVHHPQPSQATLVTSCAPGKIVSTQTIEALWFRANCIDRYASLVLGLPPASSSNDFASQERVRDDTPEDRLGKTYAVCAGQILERNSRLASSQEASALTNSIEIELESVAHLMDSAWWQLPNLREAGSALADELMVLNLQVRHYCLLLMLQLPYLLRQVPMQQDAVSREHGRSVCMHACRAVLHRFLRFRSTYQSSTTGKQIDYAALVSSMTLIQGHLVWWFERGPHSGCDEEKLRLADVELLRSAMQTMQRMALHHSGDKLCDEGAKSLQELLTYMEDFEALDSGEWASIVSEAASDPDQFLGELGAKAVFPFERV